jgi:endonuclease YncB( thermonuclease family)
MADVETSRERGMKTSLWFCAAFLCLAAGTAVAAPKKPAAPAKAVVFSGTVSRIVDGDTLWLKTEGDGEPPVVVRIEGIDAPEICQPGGAEATAALNALALGRAVTVRAVARDEFGRTIGKVYDGEKDIGDRMVRDGMAWSSRFNFDRGPYVAEERMALALKRGLHAAGGAIQPREFRQRHGPCEGATPKPVAAATAVTAKAPAPAQPRGAGTGQRCDGRQVCSQMTSCAEATWFLKNCPGVKMDGNRDGIPCETQWCNKR